MFTRKHLCWTLFIKKRLQNRFFPANIETFLTATYIFWHTAAVPQKKKIYISTYRRKSFPECNYIPYKNSFEMCHFDS